MSPVKAGEILVIVPCKPVDGWRYVVDFPTGLMGWVKEARLDMQLTSVKKKMLTFVRHPKPDEIAPQITLQNDSEYNVRLRLDDQTVLITAGSVKKIPVSPGTYTYIIAVPDRLPQFGTRTFDAGYGFTWSLYENNEPVLAPNPPGAK